MEAPFGFIQGFTTAKNELDETTPVAVQDVSVPPEMARRL
jgi:hypothetical protein